MSDEQQPGQGWRWIEVGEVFRSGDEIVNVTGKAHLRTSASMVPERCTIPMKYRRREKRSEAGGEVEG